MPCWALRPKKQKSAWDMFTEGVPFKHVTDVSVLPITAVAAAEKANRVDGAHIQSTGDHPTSTRTSPQVGLQGVCVVLLAAVHVCTAAAHTLESLRAKTIPWPG